MIFQVNSTQKNAPRLQGVPRGALRVARGVPQTPHAGHAVWHAIWHGQRSGQHPVFGTSRQSFTCCVTKAFNDEDHTVGTQNPSISEKWENPRAYCDIMSELPVFAMLAVCVFLSINELNKPDVCKRTSYSYFKEFRLSEISCHLLTCQSRTMLHQFTLLRCINAVHQTLTLWTLHTQHFAPWQRRSLVQEPALNPVHSENSAYPILKTPYPSKHFFKIHKSWHVWTFHERVKRQTTRHLDDSDGWDCALVERVARAHGPSNNAKVGSQNGVTQKLLTTAQM